MVSFAQQPPSWTLYGNLLSFDLRLNKTNFPVILLDETMNCQHVSRYTRVQKKRKTGLVFEQKQEPGDQARVVWRSFSVLCHVWPCWWARERLGNKWGRGAADWSCTLQCFCMLRTADTCWYKDRHINGPKLQRGEAVPKACLSPLHVSPVFCACSQISILNLACISAQRQKEYTAYSRA